MISILYDFLGLLMIFLVIGGAFRSAIRFTITTYFKALAKHDKENP